MVQKTILETAGNNLPSKTKHENLMQILALLSASMVTFSFGTFFAWPSPSIPLLLSPKYNITLEQTSYLPVVSHLSMALWTPVYCKLIDVIGRKYTIFSCSVLHVTAWLLIAFAKEKYYLYIISRLISGMADACCMASVPTYIAEVTKPQIRDTYGHSIMIALFIGQFTVNCVGYYCDIPTTAFILLTIPVVFAAIFIFMPESPYYCCMKKRYSKAESCLQVLYGKKNVEQELRQLKSDVERQMSETGRFIDLIKIKSNRRALIITNVTRIFQQLCGITGIVSYAQYIFQLGGSDMDSGVAAMLLNVLLAIGSLFTNAISNKIGKTFTLIVSFTGTGIALLGLTIYFYFDIYTEADVEIVNYLPVIGLIFFIISYSVGLASIPTTLIGEIFSASIRSKAAMIAIVVFALSMGGTNKLFQFLMSSYGLCVPYLLFTICSFAGAIITYYIVPNTHGKSLEEIQQILKGNIK